MSYYQKVRAFNKRTEYSEDIKFGNLLLEYCVNVYHKKKIFVIGTGLGGDIKVFKGIKSKLIVGIEPRKQFYTKAVKEYQRLGGTLLNLNLGQFVEKSNQKLTGIFVFMHSINHIPRKELKVLAKSMKNSLIIIINPNPQLTKITGKTDKTVISYLSAKRIQKIFDCNVVFDFFYGLIKIKGKNLLLREALLLKSRD